ncbi:NAD(P)-binding protein, partial [Penicillium angulare]
TGVTGYIGGDALHAITQSVTSSSIVALIRSEDRAATVTEKFPNVVPLIGDLDSIAKISQEAQRADIVLSMASGLRFTYPKELGNFFANRGINVWIQIGGGSVLSGPEVASKTYGHPGSKLYNDLPGASEIQDIITASPKRVVDHILRNLNSSRPNVRTATVYGPLIYGQGRGPVNQRSIQIPDLAKASLKFNHGIHVGKGLNAWSNVHVSDLTHLIVKLILEASGSSNPRLWNENGLFFAESGRMASLASFSVP